MKIHTKLNAFMLVVALLLSLTAVSVSATDDAEILAFFNSSTSYNQLQQFAEANSDSLFSTYNALGDYNELTASGKKTVWQRILGKRYSEIKLLQHDIYQKVFRVYDLEQISGNTGSGGGGGGSASADTSWYNGIDMDFEISNADQLAGLAELVNGGADSFEGKTITLTTDIDLSEYGVDWNDGKGWIPIGHTYPNIFEGTFDGNYKVINNLYVNNPYVDPVNHGYDAGTGFLGYITGAEVKNLGLVNASVNGGGCVGLMVGGAECSSLIKNCYVTGAASGVAGVGGVVGCVYDSNVEECYAISSVSGISSVVGGIVGGLLYDSFLLNCYAKGNVSCTGGSYVGGIVGEVAGSSVENCYATGEVNATGSYAGGIVGMLGGNKVVKKCVALNSDVSGATPAIHDLDV